MTEQPFGQEELPVQQDSISHSAGSGLSENVFSQHQGNILAADSDHNTMTQQAKTIAALMSRLEKYEKPQEVLTAPPGGTPVAHHLHLVDGRVVVNHGGIATHYSETLSDGSTRITRVKEYYPVVEPDPASLNV